MMTQARSTLAVFALSLSTTALACTAAAPEEQSAASEDEIVATFDGAGRIDLRKTSRILLVGDSDDLGDLPLWAATTKARRLAQLYPEDQIVLFVTQDVKDASVARAGGKLVEDEPFGDVTLSDLRRLGAAKLVGALDRFSRIAAIEFFGHSSPFGALLEAGGEDRTLDATESVNLAALGDNFARDANPYVALNGCNGGVQLAPELSRLWQLPVSGALTGSNFQVLMSDGRWYPNDKGAFPAGLTEKSSNDQSFGAESAAACNRGSCVRMKPQDSPYRGVWADPKTGFQFGLGYYKFFCDYADANESCAKGMATSLYAFPSNQPIDRRSNDAAVQDVLADFLCNADDDAAWFDQCRTQLFESVASGAAFSPMKSANDYSLECDFGKCEQKLRCKMDGDAPQRGSCAWVDAACPDDATAASCRTKNTTKQTTRRELDKYLAGHRLLRGG